MTIDYAKKEAQKKAPAKRNSRKGKAASKPRNQPSALIWLATGLALGLLIAFLYHLATLPTAGVSVVEAPTVNPTTNESDTRFDFYTLLPESEVIVDRTSTNQTKDTTKFVYYLQAGSFIRDADAQQRKAELALLGFEANIEIFTNQGSTWHRMLMGPLASRSKLASVRNQLIQEGIDSMVIKRKVN